jgi:hypothetical protein
MSSARLSRANAVHAFLVLLDLLKGQAEAISQVGLTEFEHQPPHADAAADLLVDGGWRETPSMWLSVTSRGSSFLT